MTELENAARTRVAEPMIDFEVWLRQGMDAGFTGPPVCATHDGTPTSAEEDEAYEDGEDPCTHVLRLYTDDAERVSVEANHAPSVWRRTNRG